MNGPEALEGERTLSGAGLSREEEEGKEDGKESVHTPILHRGLLGEPKTFR